MKRVLTISLCLTVVSAAVILLGSLVRAAPHGAWIKDSANPVLESGPEDSWNHNGVRDPTVIRDGTTYKMWHVGEDDNGQLAIGYATSSDGITWIEYAGNPVLTTGTSGSWDSRYVLGPSVVKSGTTYHMWYWAYNDNWEVAIGHATSSDGITWFKDPANPVLTTGTDGSWDSLYVYSPSVIQTGAAFEMWYGGADDNGVFAVGHATSLDGTVGTLWAKDPANPVLEPGADGAWDESEVGYPSALYDGAATLYRIWYRGCGNGDCSFGYASSLDGVNWSKHPSNPILYPGPSGGWDGQLVFEPSVVQTGTTYEMWYAGYGVGTGGYGIGRAVAAPGAWITGHIYDDASSPLAGARIFALDDDLNVIASTVSEADGSYAIVDLPTDDYFLEVNATGYGREYYTDSHDIASAIQVSATVPITTASVDFTLAPGAVISGHVYGPDSVTPFDGALVEVQPAGGGRPMNTTSGSDGTYTMDDLATGSYGAWAGHSSYLADASGTPIGVTQPSTTTGVDFVLLGPYFPLNVGDSWVYSWSNDTYHPDLIRETIQVSEKNGSQYTLSAHHTQANGQFWIGGGTEGLEWRGYSTYGSSSSFPLPMYMLPYYANVPTDFFGQPLLPGESWLGSGRGHTGLSTVVSATETITVTAGTFTSTLRIHTTISGTSDYLSGERDMWFAAGVGLVKLVYQHDDGSTTTAELVGGPYGHHVYLPLAVRGHETDPPAVVSTYPLDGATGVSRNLLAVSITFDEPMNDSSWSLSSDGGFPLGSAQVSYNPSSYTFTFTRTTTDPLPASTTMAFTINPGGYGTGFVDLSGNPAPTTSFSFTTTAAQ